MNLPADGLRIRSRLSTPISSGACNAMRTSTNSSEGQRAIAGAGVPSDHVPTQTMRIVNRSSGSSAAMTGEPGRLPPSSSPRGPEQKTSDADASSCPRPDSSAGSFPRSSADAVACTIAAFEAPESGARIGELLALCWEHCQDGYLAFWETNNGKARRIPLSAATEAVLANQPRMYPSVFADSRTGPPLTPNGVAHVSGRAIRRAGITTGDVTLHTLRTRRSAG
jgi:hypothetical protein